MYYVSASTSINAPRQLIWDLIKPAEKAPLLSPETVCGFRAPDVEGLGEMHVPLLRKWDIFGRSRNLT